MSMRTPLSRVRGLGSAKSGTTHFWHQRLTAVANIPLAIFTVWLVVALANSTHAEAAALLSSNFVAVGLILALASMLYHMRLGMQVVIEDYIHHEGLKILLIMGNTFFTLAIGALAAYSVLKLGFGA